MYLSLSAGGTPADTIASLRAQAAGQTATHPAAGPALEAIVALVEADTQSVSPTASVSVSASISIAHPNS